MFSITFLLFTLLVLLPSLTAQTLSGNKRCSPGNYHVPSQGCLKCPSGTFQDEPGKTRCKPCLNNTASPAKGATKCMQCGPYGKANFSHTKCDCVAGAWLPLNNKCKLCPAGKYQVNRGTPPHQIRKCWPCFWDMYQPKAGQTECLKCPGNSFTSDDGTKCILCPRGTVFFNGKCGRCPPGQEWRNFDCQNCFSSTFKAKTGQKPCRLCPRNGYALEGATSCRICPEGKAPIKTNKGKCGDCPPGHWYDTNSFYCVKCNQGEFMPRRGVREHCFNCAGNAFSVPQEGAAKCVKCPSGKSLMKDGTCAFCPAGTQYDDYLRGCKGCEPGYFKRDPRDLYCITCPQGSSSLYRAEKCTYCPPGTLLIPGRGKKCGRCPAGFFLETGYGAPTCEQCPSGMMTRKRNVLSSCESCPPGKKANALQTACIPR